MSIATIALLATLTLHQANPDTVSPFVFQITTFQGNRVLSTGTAFRLAGTRGLITALHVVANGQVDFISIAGKRLALIQKSDDRVKVVAVSKALDLARLDSNELESKLAARGSGLRPVPDDKWKERSDVCSFGHPLSLVTLTSEKYTVRRPPVAAALSTMFSGASLPVLETLKKRKSPDPGTEVVWLQGKMEPGWSGAPVFCSDEVVGVADGVVPKPGFTPNSWEDTDFCWATVLPHSITWSTDVSIVQQLSGQKTPISSRCFESGKTMTELKRSIDDALHDLISGKKSRIKKPSWAVSVDTGDPTRTSIIFELDASPTEAPAYRKYMAFCQYLAALYPEWPVYERDAIWTQTNNKAKGVRFDIESPDGQTAVQVHFLFAGDLNEAPKYRAWIAVIKLLTNKEK